jgi:hypothetical protein
VAFLRGAVEGEASDCTQWTSLAVVRLAIFRVAIETGFADVAFVAMRVMLAILEKRKYHFSTLSFSLFSFLYL